MNNRLKFFITVALVASIVVLGSLLIFRKPSSQPTPSIPISSPIPSASAGVIVLPSLAPGTPKPRTTQVPIRKLTMESLISLTPVETELFDIEYYSESGRFRITIKESPYEGNKLQAQKWLEDRGLNLDELNIVWFAYRYVE